MNPETKLQNEIRATASALFHPYVISLRTNSGAARAIGSDRRIRLAQGGTEDLVFLVGGLYVALEVKLPGEDLRKNQKDRQAAVILAGGISRRVDSVPGAMAEIADALEASPLASSKPDLIRGKIEAARSWIETNPSSTSLPLTSRKRRRKHD